MVVGKSFVVEPGMYLRHESNPAYVMGEKAHPASFRPLWLAVIVSAVVDVGLLMLGLDALPLELPEELSPMQPFLLLMGIIGIPATIFMGWVFSKIQNQGMLLEGRVVISDMCSHRSRPGRQVQH